MVVATAVPPAGGIVLPEGIVRISDIVTITAKIDALDEMLDQPFGTYYFNALLLTAEGRVKGDRSLYGNIPEIEQQNGGYCQAIHVYRNGGELDDYDFFYDEVVASLEQNPWMQHSWFRDNMLRWAELLPKPSQTPGLLAYFQTPEKRARNIRTPIKPGRFLKKYFGDILSEPEIHELALEWSNEFDIKQARITQNADEIEEIYVNGPHSCMAYAFRGQPHPARVYAGPDLGVAYLGSIEDADARAVVWPDRKIYATPYGDESRMEAALKALGYQRGTFRGARLRHIEWNGQVVLPYLDIADSAEVVDDYVVIGRGGNLDTSNQNGLATREPEYTCDDCGDGMDEDESCLISTSERSVCGHCYHRGYFYCEGSNGDYENSEKADVVDTVGENYSKWFVERSEDWFFCESTELYYPTKDYHLVVTYEDECIANTVAEEDGFFCEHIGKWTLETHHQVKLTNGKSVHMGTFDSERAFNEWLLANNAIVGNPELIDPNQLPLPLSEAA